MARPALQLNKESLRTELLTRLEADLAALEQAQQATVAGATHAEARAENDKDTRALEQTYLARGQAMRVEETRDAVARVRAMPLKPFAAGTPISLGALVTAEDDDGTYRYFMAPAGGGVKLAQATVQVVTPASPLGAALVGKPAGDEAEVKLAGKLRTLSIVTVE